MPEKHQGIFPKSKLLSMRRMWSQPEENPDSTWTFDGVAWSTEHWMSYDYQMLEGLKRMGCQSFDQLVVLLAKKLGRPPNVVDLMGGAYFLLSPENANSLAGIRLNSKDQRFLQASQRPYYHRDQRAKFDKVITAPNRRVIEANVLTNAGWKTIQNANLPPADLLVCRPVGPFDIRHAMAYAADNPDIYSGLYASLFHRMLSLVNQQTGVIFSEIPDIFETSQATQFFRKHDQKVGSKTEVFTVQSKDYHWGGKQRRYFVSEFNQ